MKTVREAYYPDLMEKYENPIEHGCDIEEGAVFIANGWQRPDGLCESAWESMSTLCNGTGSWCGEFLRRLDEEPPLGDDFLQ